MSRRTWLLLTVLVSLAACSEGPVGESTIDRGNGGETPEATIELLIQYLDGGDFTSAASLAIPDQAALASLAEGATVAEVANALREGDAIIAANFWSGFAQSVGNVLSAGLSVTGSTNTSAVGVDFAIVDVATVTGGSRQLITRDMGGHRVDLFATFGPSLAGKLYSPVERLLSSPVEDATMVLSSMRDQIPSLHMAAQTPGLASTAVQDVLRLIELISRVS